MKTYNLPLQVWPEHEDPDDEETPIVGHRILNYMPRKEGCIVTDIEELIGEQTREEFFEQAARVLENLARLMRLAKTNKAQVVYYPDEGMND